MRFDQRRFSGSASRYCRHPLYFHVGYNHTLIAQRLSQSVHQALIRESFARAAEQHSQSVGLLRYLPGSDWQKLHHLMESGRMHQRKPAFWLGEPQHVFCAPLYVVNEREGSSAGAGALSQSYAVAQVIADQRLGAAEENHDQQLVAVDPWRHRAVVSVYHLADHQILKEVQTLMPVAFRGEATALGGGILVE